MPTYKPGKVLWINYGWKSLQRMDVVVVKTDEGYIIKRVSYLPGDNIYQISWQYGRSWIVITKSQAKIITKLYKRKKIPVGFQIRKLTIPPDCVYVNGDNRSLSDDSDHFGPVSIKSVIGVIL